MTTLITLSGFKPNFVHFVVYLDKALYNDYLCLVALNKCKFSGQEFEEIVWEKVFWKKGFALLS